MPTPSQNDWNALQRINEVVEEIESAAWRIAAIMRLARSSSTEISEVQQLDGLPAILESGEPEFIVVSTSVNAILPKTASASTRPTIQ